VIELCTFDVQIITVLSAPPEAKCEPLGSKDTQATASCTIRQGKHLMPALCLVTRHTPSAVGSSKVHPPCALIDCGSACRSLWTILALHYPPQPVARHHLWKEGHSLSQAKRGATRKNKFKRLRGMPGLNSTSLQATELFLCVGTPRRLTRIAGNAEQLRATANPPQNRNPDTTYSK
jgi:hypothetical protein